MHRLLKLFQGITTLSLILGMGVTATATVAVPNNYVAYNKQSKPPTDKYTYKDDVNNFKFQLQKCQRKGTQVNCSVLITNLNKESVYLTVVAPLFGSGCRALDFDGNEYLAQTVQLGSDGPSDNGARSFLIPRVGVKSIVSFQIPTNVKKLSAFVLYTADYNFNPLSGVTFYDVNISS